MPSPLLTCQCHAAVSVQTGAADTTCSHLAFKPAITKLSTSLNIESSIPKDHAAATAAAAAQTVVCASGCSGKCQVAAAAASGRARDQVDISHGRNDTQLACARSRCKLFGCGTWCLIPVTPDHQDLSITRVRNKQVTHFKNDVICQQAQAHLRKASEADSVYARGSSPTRYATKKCPASCNVTRSRYDG